MTTESNSQRGRRKFKTTPLPEDDPLYSNAFVIGQSQPKRPPVSIRHEGRGRGLPHQYPWVDKLEDIELSEASEEDVEENRND